MTRTREENAADLVRDGAWRETLLPVYVIVRGEASESEDEAVPGIYLCYVDPSLSDGERAEVALDHFHENNGIGCLDDFSIDVVDTDGNVLPRLDAYENGSRSAYGDYGDRLEDGDAPAAVSRQFESGIAGPGI